MQKKSGVAIWVISRMLVMAGAVVLAACARSGDNSAEYAPVATPTVDYVESLDVYSAPHQDSFLNQLAMNYRSYAIYNARTSGYPDMGELFANKAVAAFSGDVPFPESLENWPVENEQEAFELYTAYNDLMEQLKNDASYQNPELAAETQAKFDCWLSASASGQIATANQCRDRFQKAMVALRDCHGGKVVKAQTSEPQPMVASEMQVETESRTAGKYYPDTRNMNAMRGAGQARDGVIIVNNVNVPEHLIKPVPVQPMVFNQNIYGGDKTSTDNSVKNSNNSAAVDCLHGAVNCPPSPTVAVSVTEKEPMIGEELVTREEFINMMMAMRAELAAINSRLDQLQAAAGEKNHD